MAILTWLHLSDWHQGADDYDRKVVAQALQDDLHRRAALDPVLEQIDFVFFTGDLAFGGKKQQYAEARDLLLEPIRTTLKLEKERLFLIPGNHDLDRDKFDLLPDALMRPFKDNREANKWHDDKDRQAELCKPFRAYQEFVNEYQPIGFDAYGDFRNLTVKGKEVGIIGVNSALMCGRPIYGEGGSADLGKLVVGEPQILPALRAIEQTDIRIALIHHPFDWLNELDRNIVEAHLLKGCDFILRGHVHQQHVQVTKGTQGGCVIVPGGACFDGRVPYRTQYINAYNYVSFDTQTQQGTVYLRCWRKDDTGWTTDYEKGNLGQYAFSIGTPSLPMPPAANTSSPPPSSGKNEPVKQLEEPHPTDNAHARTPFVDLQTDVAYFDELALRGFRSTMKEDARGDYPASLSSWDFLGRAGLMKNGHLTHAGVLLFGDNPCGLLRTAYTRCVRYDGINKAAGRKSKEFRQTLAAQGDAIYEFVRDNTGRLELPTEESVRASVTYEYPMRCVREIVVNALIHRDYTDAGRHVHVRLFSDRIEVTSPGRWFGRDLPDNEEVSLQTLEGEAGKPNHTLAQILSWKEYVEDEGSGIPYSIGSCQEIGAPIPTVKQQDGYVIVTIRPGTKYQEARERSRGSTSMGAVDSQGNTASAVSPRRGRLSQGTPPPNPFFTGREAELERLHVALQGGNTALTPIPQALQGLGGVGKTQTALAYVHRYRQEYEGVFWVQGETPEQLTSQLAALAPELDPPVPIQPDQEATLSQVNRWFTTHSGWLLVIDNAEHLSELRDLLPRHPAGHILLTTRETIPATLAARIEIEYLNETTGAMLLLRRAGTLAPDQNLDAADTQTQVDAQTVSRELGGLPLALDQAGAYMGERSLAPATYLRYYRQRRQQLHRNYQNSDHASVSVTFALALEQARQLPEVGPAALELAQLCALLAPDPIPDEVFLTSPHLLPAALAASAQDEIAFTDLCAAVGRYGLLRRETTPPGLTMHRLAQEVARDGLPLEARQTIAEQVTLAVNAAFPAPEFRVWALCDRLLSHALICAEHIADYHLRLAEAAVLLNKTATYLQQRARYAEAEPLFRRAVSILQERQGMEHPDVGAALNNLAALYREMGRYEDAVPLLEEALAIGRKTEGEMHPNFASSLDNLAGVYSLQGRYEEAEPLRLQALHITRRTQGEQHPDLAVRLNNLANLYVGMARYDEAESLLQQALDIDRQALGACDPLYATHLVNLAGLYLNRQRFDEAEPLLQEALAIYAQVLGKEHPNVAACHYWLGIVCHEQGDQTTAANHFRLALEIQERIAGPDHPDTISVRNWLAVTEQK